MRLRVLRGAKAQAFAVACRIAEHILVLPVFLLTWGPEIYADWLLLHAVSLLVSFSDLGQMTHWANRLSSAYARQEFDEFRRLVPIGFCVAFGTVTVVGTLIGFALITVGPTFLASTEAMDGGTAAATFTVLILASLVILGQGYFIGLYRAVGEFPSGTIAGAATVLMTSFSLVLALALGAGPVVAAGTIALVHALGTLWMAAHLLKRFPVLRPARCAPRRPDFEGLVGRAPFNLLPQIGQWVWQSGTLTIIGLTTAAPDIIVAFVALRTLSSIPRVVLIQLAQGIGVEIARAFAQQDFGAISRLLAGIAPMLSCVSGAAAGILVGIGPPLLQFWSADHVAVEPGVFVILAIGTVVIVPANLAAMALLFTGRPHHVALGTLVGMAAGQSLVYALTPEVGLWGAILGVVVGESLLQSLVSVRAAERLLPIGWFKLLASALGRGLIVCVAAAATSTVASEFAAPLGLPMQISIGAACGVMIASMIIAGIGLAPHHREWLWSHLKGGMISK